MASLKDIAEAAGVSIRTVSRTLRESGYVAEETRQRVLSAVRRLDYRPNLMARALKMGRGFEIVAVLGSMDELLIGKISGFEQRLRAAGYSVHVLFEPEINTGEGLPRELLNVFQERTSAGVALFPRYDAAPREAPLQLRELGLHCVAVDAPLAAGDLVRIDRQQGIYEAVHYLARAGRRRIAYLGPVDGAHARTRRDGYERAICELGREPLIRPACGAAPAVDEYEAGREGGERLCAARPRPDAIQVHSDVMAMGLLATLHEHGVKVPGDVAVVGFDNRQVASLCWPRLTTVAQPNHEVGQAAAEILLARIEGRDEPAEGWSRTLPTRLVVRDSA